MAQKHPIKVVVNRTGISPHLIRMWERRYSAVVPERTPTGRRLYTDEDIERLSLMRQATLAGETISQIAKLSRDELADLVPKTYIARNNDSLSKTQVTNLDYHFDLCMQAILALDPVNLEARLLRASMTLGQEIFLERVLQPLLQKTGEMWADGRLKVAHEHLASAVIRSLLGSMYVSSRNDDSGPLLVCTTPSGQFHEFWALMVAVTAVASGWKTIYLGPNMPAEDIASAALQGNARAIAISLVYPEDDPQTIHELRKLKQLLKDNYAIIAGGRVYQSYDSILDEINAIRVNSLAELRSKLLELNRQKSKV